MLPCSDYFASVHSLTDYYICSMDLLDANVRRQLFDVKSRPIYTKIRNSPPTVYSREGIVKNSLVADGCLIEGTVENSILFRGVKVGKSTHILQFDPDAGYADRRKRISELCHHG